MKVFPEIHNSSMISRDCEIADDVVVYAFCNIYNRTVINSGCKIGAYTEISGALIQKGVSIGAKCFIPKGVIIQSGVWVGPGVFFTHSFPPATQSDWIPIIVEEGAMIGANCTIKEGVIIGKNSRIGCGSVVIKSVPYGEVWAGNPAKKIEVK